MYTLISIIGLSLFAYSTRIKNFELAILGRAIFGMGAEGQIVWYSTIISIWFYYGEISLALA